MNTKALRQKILDLAIHGKLVPQDPNDEPASVLLERIRAEKERLIKEGKIKRPKKAKATSDKPHYPYELPKGWVWCKLEDIAYVASGSTPDKSSFVSNGIPYIKMYNLRNQNIDFKFKPQFIKEDVHNGKLIKQPSGLHIAIQKGGQMENQTFPLSAPTYCFSDKIFTLGRIKQASSLA